MALEVEDGTGRSNAESYVSVSSAAAYHLARGNADAWDAIDGKEAALRLATEYMEQVYRLRWSGYRVKSTQRLSWPRAEVPLPDSPFRYGYSYLAIDVVPEEVKNACSELALLTANGPLAPNVEPTVSQETVGPISVTYDPNASTSIKYCSVDGMLAPFLTGRGSEAMTKLVRT